MTDRLTIEWQPEPESLSGGVWFVDLSNPNICLNSDQWFGLKSGPMVYRAGRGDDTEEQEVSA